MEQEQTLLEPQQESQPSTEPSQERVTPSRKAYSQEAYSIVQSERDTLRNQAAQSQAALQSLNEQLRNLQAEQERHKEEAERAELARYDGDSEMQSAIRARHQVTKEREQLKRERAESQQRATQIEAALQNKWDWAVSLARQYGVDAHQLYDRAESPSHMEDLAKLHGVQRTQAQTGQVAPGTFEQSPFDSGRSDAGGVSDDAFLRSYAEGKTDDHARAKKLLDKLK